MPRKKRGRIRSNRHWDDVRNKQLFTKLTGVVPALLAGNAVPERPGGGTVFYVTEEDHRYLR